MTVYYRFARAARLAKLNLDDARMVALVLRFAGRPTSHDGVWSDDGIARLSGQSDDAIAALDSTEHEHRVRDHRCTDWCRARRAGRWLSRNGGMVRT